MQRAGRMSWDQTYICRRHRRRSSPERVKRRGLWTRSRRSRWRTVRPTASVGFSTTSSSSLCLARFSCRGRKKPDRLYVSANGCRGFNWRHFEICWTDRWSITWWWSLPMLSVERSQENVDISALSIIKNLCKTERNNQLLTLCIDHGNKTLYTRLCRIDG